MRELDARGAAIHIISGDIDDPAIARPPSEHHRLLMPKRRGAITRVKAQRIRSFHRNAHVEGIAVQDDGTVWYAHDDEQIRLSVAKL